ncbi:peptidylprolyl isomerase, partial [Candidatus Woesearchaeota archaeon]|nr:peptidylprolyl isomerase [Candidatus Woesearchaeota archaeon]
MKKLLLIFILLSTMLSAEIIDRIIAKVGNNIILESELDEQIQQIKAFNNTELELSNFDILNKIIETELIIQKAKKEGYEINEISIKAMAEQQIQSIASQFSSEYEFKTELKKAGFTVSKLKEHYTKQIKQQQLQERIINAEIKNKIVTTEAEILEYYNENKENYLRPEMVKLGLIMRSINASTETQKTILEEMTRIRNEVINGADFQKLAKENSDCPSAEKGGNLGFFGKGRMVKPFEAAAFKLNIGEISEIVKTDFGYHIIKLNAKNDDEIDVSHILKKIE